MNSLEHYNLTMLTECYVQLSEQIQLHFQFLNPAKNNLPTFQSHLYDFIINAILIIIIVLTICG